MVRLDSGKVLTMKSKAGAGKQLIEVSGERLTIVKTVLNLNHTGLYAPGRDNCDLQKQEFKTIVLNTDPSNNCDYIILSLIAPKIVTTRLGECVPAHANSKTV